MKESRAITEASSSEEYKPIINSQEGAVALPGDRHGLAFRTERSHRSRLGPYRARRHRLGKWDPPANTLGGYPDLDREISGAGKG